MKAEWMACESGGAVAAMRILKVDYVKLFLKYANEKLSRRIAPGEMLT